MHEVSSQGSFTDDYLFSLQLHSLSHDEAMMQHEKSVITI